MSNIVEAKNLVKSYPLPDGSPLTILRDVTFAVRQGEAVAIMGVSGSGKTTLLNILAGIDKADSGSLSLPFGRPGLIFQLHYLMPELDAMENVAITPRVAGTSRKMAAARAKELLSAVGLGERLRHMPSELSGGEVARVAIARALAANASLILADEPTGNLDEDTSENVQHLLFETVRKFGEALIIVTHDPRVAAKADRVLKLEHGVFR